MTYDPDRDELRYAADGSPLTREVIEQLADEAEAGYDLDSLERLPGRPSMSGTGDSPQIRVRVPASLRDRAEARARSEGRSVSAVTREALERYLAS